MTAPLRFWADLATTDFAALDLSRAIAVLPVAATEQHGPHLPLSVDTDLVNGVVQAALPHLPAELPALFLPTQTVGLSPEHARFAGTLTLKAETVIRLWTDIGESVAASGVKKLVLLNAHGGQVGVMDIVARDLRARLGMLVYSVSWFNLPLHDAQGRDVNALFSPKEHRFGVHAGEVETSMILALRPDLVRMDRAQDFHSSAQDRAERFPILGNGKSAKLGWQMQDYNPQGAAGNAAAAKAEKGQALLDVSGRALAQLLTEIDQLPPGTLTDQVVS
jgi:creatinine amidohydrolase